MTKFAIVFAITPLFGCFVYQDPNNAIILFLTLTCQYPNYSNIYSIDIGLCTYYNFKAQ